MSARSSTSGSSSRGNYRERRLPKTAAVNALLYFSGRNPMLVKSIRAYDYEDDVETRSTGSGSSMFSWSSGRSDVYLVESTTPYWWDYADPEPSTTRKKRESSKKGRSSRASQPRAPTGTWPRNATAQDVSDDDDDDDESSVGSFEDYGHPQPSFQQPPFPHPGMMHPPPHGPSPGPPPGAFQPVYPGMYAHATPPPPPPAGFGPPPPPPAAAPPPPGGHFVTGRGGIQVFVDG